jgi:hypothetical protein
VRDKAVRIVGVCVCLFVCSLGVVSSAFAGYAVAENDNDVSVIYLGTKKTPTPKYLSQKKALEAQEKTKALIRIAYNLSLGKDLTLAELPKNEYYYLNPYTNILAVAASSVDAEELSYTHPKVYYAVAGETLSTTLKRWANKNGMKLIFKADTDYMIQYPYVFHGELTAPDGPTNALLESFVRGKHAMKAVITKNNIMMIMPNTYLPAPVIGV